MNTVLVVDDSMTDMEVVTKCLQQSGMSVIAAKNGEEAIAKLNSMKPDVIVMDVVLPDRSGFELCREIKGAANTSEIPVILCSTKGTEMDKFWGLKQGANAYLAKPIDQEELVRTVQQWAR